MGQGIHVHDHARYADRAAECEPPLRHAVRQVRRTAKVIYVDVAEELQREAVDKLAFLFEEPEG